LNNHNGWVRDVAWASNIGLPYYTLASCDQNGVVLVSSQDQLGGEWQTKELQQPSSGVVWRVSWSITGNVLAVSGGDNRVSLWKQSLDQGREWKLLSQMDEEGALAYAHS
jgi:protein transport protein SEC13